MLGSGKTGRARSQHPVLVGGPALGERVNSLAGCSALYRNEPEGMERAVWGDRDVKRRRLSKTATVFVWMLAGTCGAGCVVAGNTKQATRMVFGKVVGPGRSGIRNIPVRAYRYPLTERPRVLIPEDSTPLAEATTDERGDFSIGPFPIGEYLVVEVAGNDYGRVSRMVPVLSSQQEAIVFRVEPAGAVCLRVTPCQWRMLVWTIGADTYHKVGLDDRCFGCLEGVRPGWVEIHAWSDEWGVLGRGYSVDVVPGRNREESLELWATAIVGIVRCDGEPVADLGIEAWNDDMGGPVVFTRGDGDFAFLDLEPGTWELVVGASAGQRTKPIRIAAGETKRVVMDLQGDVCERSSE